MTLEANQEGRSKSSLGRNFFYGTSRIIFGGGSIFGFISLLEQAPNRNMQEVALAAIAAGASIWGLQRTGLSLDLTATERTNPSSPVTQ